MAKNEFSLEGVKEFDKLLDELDAKTHIKIVNDFVFETAKKTILPELKKNAPLGDDRLFNDLKVRKGKRGGAFVGNTTDTYWSRFYEYGTVVREHKSGKSTGKMTAKPFIEKSFDSTFKDAIVYFRTKFGERIEKILKRNVKRINKRNGI